MRATGPESVDNNNSWWSVIYEIFVPQNTDLTVTARNGGIDISGVRGQIRVRGPQRRRALETACRRRDRIDRQRRSPGGIDRRDLGWAAIWNSRLGMAG